MHIWCVYTCTHFEINVVAILLHASNCAETKTRALTFARQTCNKTLSNICTMYVWAANVKQTGFIWNVPFIQYHLTHGVEINRTRWKKKPTMMLTTTAMKSTTYMLPIARILCCSARAVDAKGQRTFTNARVPTTSNAARHWYARRRKRDDNCD